MPIIFVKMSANLVTRFPSFPMYESKGQVGNHELREPYELSKTLYMYKSWFLKRTNKSMTESLGNAPSGYLVFNKCKFRKWTATFYCERWMAAILFSTSRWSCHFEIGARRRRQYGFNHVNINPVGDIDISYRAWWINGEWGFMEMNFLPLIFMRIPINPYTPHVSRWGLMKDN